MSEQNGPQSQYPQIRIVHRADGTAVVDGVPVRTKPGEHVRDAAYAAAVALVARAPGPVVAVSVEPDGTEYPLTLYPRHPAFAAGDAGAAAGRAQRTYAVADRIVRRGVAALPTRLPVLRLGWLLAAVFGCVLVATVTAVLLESSGTSVVRLSVEQQKDPADAGPQQAAGSWPAAGPTTAGNALGALAQRGVAGISLPAKPSGPSTRPAAGLAGPASAATAPAALPSPPGGNPSQPSGSRPAPSTAPARPDPAPAGPVTVRQVSLALLGGDKKDPSVTYVITLSTSSPNPVTLTYSYAGSRGTAAETRSVTLSGETEYAVTGVIAGRPYCGQTVSVRAWTSPAAATGAVGALTTPGC